MQSSWAPACSAALPSEHQKVANANTESEELQHAMECAGSEMWTVEVVTCQVTQPDEELHNAAAILSHRGSGTGDSAGVVEAKVYAVVTVYRMV